MATKEPLTTEVLTSTAPVTLKIGGVWMKLVPGNPVEFDHRTTPRIKQLKKAGILVAPAAETPKKRTKKKGP